MSLITILLIVLVIALLGGFTGWPDGPGYGLGHGVNGLLLVIIIVVVILLLAGRI